MKHFIVTLLVGFWLLGPHAFADVSAKNGISITTASTINGKTPNSAFNGLTIVSGGGGGPSLIASVGTNGGTNDVTSGSINTTGANLLVVSVSWYNPIDPTPTLTDSKSNTWTALTTRSGGNISNKIYYCYGGTVGTGHTFTWSGSTIYPSINVSAWSGISASPFDVENGAGTASSWASLSTGSVTPSQANTLVIAALGFENNVGGTISIGSSFTITDTVPYAGGAGEGSAMAYVVLASSSAQNPAWATSVNSISGAAAIAVFKY